MMKQVDPVRLSQMMCISETPDMLIWPERDRAAMFQHQLRMPLLLAAAPEHPGTREGEDADDPHHDQRASTWRALLTEPVPSLKMLRAAKRFAKNSTRSDEPPIPPELATVLYYATIAAALVRLGERLSSLDDAALRAGFQWGLEQSWVDPGVAELFQNGVALLET